MFRDITPEKAIEFTQYSVALTCCWPVSTQDGSQVTRFKIFRCLVLLNAFLLFLPLVYSLYTNHNDYVNFSKCICLFIAVTQILWNTSICIIHQDHFLELIAEMKECLQHAKSYERSTYQRYVGKYSMFYAVSTVWFYVTASIIIIGTLFLPQPFPTNAEYPFPVDHQPFKSIIFLHQSFLLIQCSAHVCINTLCALLMLFAAARFEILKIKLRAVKNYGDMIECVKKYYTVKRYAKRVSIAVRFIALVTVTMCGTVLVFCGVNFIEEQPFTVQIQFLSLAVTGLIEVFMFAWPADHLLDLSQNTMQVIYESLWYRRSKSMQKDMTIMLLPQAPVAIKILYFIPIMSLNYYCSFVSNVLSLFTVLRATIKTGEHNG